MNSAFSPVRSGGLAELADLPAKYIS